VLSGNVDGTFQAATSYSTGQGTQPFSVLAADFNGDGRPDLATANFFASSVSVLLSTPPAPSSSMPKHREKTSHKRIK
jgi:hypothetical protein